MNKEKRIQKTSGRWTRAQHERFMKGLQKHGKNWEEIQKVVKTRTYTQVRSHAQKVFMKLQEKDLEQLLGEDIDSHYEKRSQKEETSIIVQKRQLNQRQTSLEKFLRKTLNKPYNGLMDNHEEENKQNMVMIKEECSPGQSYFMSIFQNNREYFEFGGTIMGLTSAPFHYQSSESSISSSEHLI